MSQPTLEDVRALTEWRPPLGVLSVYLGFDPADRGGAWRTELRNGLETVLEINKGAEHERRIALRATARRLAERFEDGDLRPPPRGEAGFVEVAEKAGQEHWWGTGVPPAASACVELREGPVIAPLVDLSCRGKARGVGLLSSERVRLLRSSEGTLEELADWELTIPALDWRESKSQSSSNPARTQGIGSSGHDQYDERLEHNRQRFLAECGGLAVRAMEDGELDEILVFGPHPEVESFNAGFNSPKVGLAHGGDVDLISAPKSQLSEVVADAGRRLDAERERALVERVLGEAKGGSRGAAGRQETAEALVEGRVDHLVLDGGLGAQAEPLVRDALAVSAQVTIVRDELAAPLAEAEGVAALLRY